MGIFLAPEDALLGIAPFDDLIAHDTAIYLLNREEEARDRRQTRWPAIDMPAYMGRAFNYRYFSDEEISILAEYQEGFIRRNRR